MIKRLIPWVLLKEHQLAGKKFLLDVLAMVKQLGCPIFFVKLSSADLRWNELVSIISEINSPQL